MNTPLPSIQLSALEFIPDLPFEQLREALGMTNTITTLGRRAFARYLFNMQFRRGFYDSGHSSAVDYAVSKLGMEARRAQETIQIGRQLEQMPEIDAALVCGDLGWSKMRTILRVVVPETQSEWLERADETCCRELSIHVARCKRGDLPKEKNAGGLLDLRIPIHTSLALLDHELWQRGKLKLGAETNKQISDEDMMIFAARMIISTDAEGKSAGRSKIKHSIYQIIVHEGSGETRVHTAEGDAVLTDDQAEAIAADAERLPAPSVAANPLGKTPEPMAARVRARDNQSCRNCGDSRFLHVHHVDFRSDGGKTEEGLLLTLCQTCHSLIHDGFLRIDGANSGVFVFGDRRGVPTRAPSAGLASAGPASVGLASAGRPSASAPHPSDSSSYPRTCADSASIVEERDSRHGSWGRSALAGGATWR